MSDIQIHERLTSVETHLEHQGEILTRLDERLLAKGGVVETVNRHKIYWKILGRFIVIGGTATAGAVAYALRS